MIKKSKLLFLSNLDLILIVLESLDSGFLDKTLETTLSNSYKKLTLCDIYSLRCCNFYRYYQSFKSLSLYNLIYYIWYLRITIINMQLKDLIYLLLYQVSHPLSLKNNKLIINNYLRKFKFYFREYMDFYIVTENIYFNNIVLDYFALEGLYSLYLLSSNSSIIYMWKYLKMNRTYYYY
uniref:Uncharacterized protein n=1 Tax=Compsopogon caeruleus TaxID=31354 RepID=A0A1Z1XAY0_9RHOD|nr:hypothetical protein [Compsopogon caeruleus]ARX96009.1 hypothetical protein [Compsopogon caeruleus]